jgi:LmbE family N-acetylglucosaminyl deacetylase
MFDFKRILCVEPHADDATISCGGLISRLKRNHSDCRVKLIYFCPCTEDPLNVGHLEQHRKAIKVLGVDELIERSFQRNILENYNQEIRDTLWKLNQEFLPNLVLCPNLHDFHQDHKTVAECCLTIFRNSIIFGYESIASCPDFAPNVFITLTKEDTDKKMRAIKCYKSQLEGRKSYFRMDSLMAEVTFHGAQVRVPYAEAFEFIWGAVQ